MEGLYVSDDNLGLVDSVIEALLLFFMSGMMLDVEEPEAGSGLVMDARHAIVSC